ncbi:MAG: hypothetical protein HQL76_04280 [Magnetococcales bacterium]|nr:hypothetical protein [Magnetococcales bacterium]
MTCEIDPVNRTHLVATNRFTVSEGEFDCLLEYRSHCKTIIAEGDSWFSYPRRAVFFGQPSNVVDCLSSMSYFNLLQLSSPGDEAVKMLSGSSFREIKRLLEKYYEQLDFFLFSGGGNDIVGEGDMDRFLHDQNTTPGNPLGWINQEEFNKTLEKIIQAYKRLIDHVMDCNSRCILITHTYCYPLPSNIGGAFLGGLFKTKSWIKPYMEEKGIKYKKDQYAIIKWMIDAFADELIKLRSDRVRVLDIREMMPNRTDWLNEIHLTPAAYSKVAGLFYKEIV